MSTVDVVRTVDVPIKAPRRPKPAPGAKGFSPLKIVGTAVIWLFTAFNIVLLYWLVVASFKTPVEIFQKPFALPVQWFRAGKPFRNFIYAWNSGGFGHAFMISVVLVAVSAVSIVVVAAPAAYALTRLGVRGSNSLINLFAIGMGIPFLTVTIPLYKAFSVVGLTNSLFGLYLLFVALSLPFTVFLLTGFFRSLPDELEEAASIDGASPVRTFFSIMLPLAKGGLITALILNAIGLWNETLLSIVFLSDNAKSTLARALFLFNSAANYQSEYGGLIAGVTIIVLPMLLLYILLARQIIAGLTLGSGK